MFQIAQVVEANLMDQVIKSLVVSGPLAVVLAIIVVVLWRDNKELRGKLTSILEKIANIKEDKT